MRKHHGEETRRRSYANSRETAGRPGNGASRRHGASEARVFHCVLRPRFNSASTISTQTGMACATSGVHSSLKVLVSEASIA